MTKIYSYAEQLDRSEHTTNTISDIQNVRLNETTSDNLQVVETAETPIGYINVQNNTNEITEQPVSGQLYIDFLRARTASCDRNYVKLLETRAIHDGYIDLNVEELVGYHRDIQNIGKVENFTETLSFSTCSVSYMEFERTGTEHTDYTDLCLQESITNTLSTESIEYS